MAGRLAYIEFVAPVRVTSGSAVPLVLAAALALTACASPAPNPIHAEPVRARTISVATLAFSPWEQELAPAYTQLAVLRQLAAVGLREKRIDQQTAIAIQATADRARAHLDLAAKAAGATPNAAQLAALDEARRITDLGYQLLENR